MEEGKEKEKRGESSPRGEVGGQNATYIDVIVQLYSEQIDYIKFFYTFYAVN